MDRKNIHTPTLKWRIHTSDAATTGAMRITMNTKAFFSGGSPMASAVCAVPCQTATARWMATRTAIAICVIESPRVYKDALDSWSDVEAQARECLQSGTT